MICKEKGCKEEKFAKGFCRKHYDAVYRKRKHKEMESIVDLAIYGPKENRWWEVFPETPYMEKLL